MVLLLNCALLVLVPLITTAYATASDIVDLGYAKYRGNTTFRAKYNTDVYYGIRYAKPPLGALRWAAPQDVDKDKNQGNYQLIDATLPASSCVQGVPGWAGSGNPFPPPTVPVTGEEDCLTLNIYVPTGASKSLPVVVFMHGGGYTLGSALSSGLPPGNEGFALVHASKGSMIMVSIQYRLGAYGFLASAEIRDAGALNAGLLDQRSALGWVQRHIAAFGGDPSRVTIAGLSAGGGSVVNHLIAYGGQAKPPFRGAIAEYPWFQPLHDTGFQEVQYSGLLSATDCNDLACLRSLSTSSLKIAQQQTYIQAYTNRTYGYGDFYYGPIVDGTFIRDYPSRELKSGHFSRVPLLVDHEGYEGVLFSNTSETTQAELRQDLASLFSEASPSFFNSLYQLYPRSAYNSTFFQRQAILGDSFIDCPTVYLASAFSRAGLATYKLIFNAGSQLHGATVPFIFGDPDSPFSNNATLGVIMKSWYISFVTMLDPNALHITSPKVPRWPRYESVASCESIMSVNYSQIGAIQDIDQGARCNFWQIDDAGNIPN